MKHDTPVRSRKPIPAKNETLLPYPPLSYLLVSTFLPKSNSLIQPLLQGSPFSMLTAEPARNISLKPSAPVHSFLTMILMVYLDLYIVNATHIPPPLGGKVTHTEESPQNRLYQNNGNGTFTDVTRKAGVGDTGYGVGCAAADINSDGYPEIYVTNYGPNRLYYNNGDGTFTDMTQEARVGDKRWGTSCAFLDYDLDGDVDLYVVNYMKFSIAENRWWETRGIRTYCSPTDQIAGSHFVSEPDILYRNNGDNTFTDVTESTGISHRALGLAVAVGDYNNDSYPDLHIANDMEADLFYHNNGDGTFTETADLTGTGYDGNGFPGSGMGNAFGDYDNNGYLDLVVSNASALPVILYHNESGTLFYGCLFCIRDRSRDAPLF